MIRRKSATYFYFKLLWKIRDMNNEMNSAVEPDKVTRQLNSDEWITQVDFIARKPSQVSANY